MRAKRTVTVLSSDIRPALPNETIRFTHKNRKNMKPEYKPFVDALIELAIREDIGDGDHTSLCCIDRKSTRLNSSHIEESRMPSSA